MPDIAWKLDRWGWLIHHWRWVTPLAALIATSAIYCTARAHR